jgi:hypothetical protein
MTTALELLYEYRHLMGKCASGAGLDMSEIDVVDAIEGVFSDEAASCVGGESLGLSTLLKSDSGKLSDPVQLFSVLLDRLILKGCPWVEDGAAVEVVIEDPELLLSYRFRGLVTWTCEEEEDRQTVALALVGVPVLVRRGPRAERAAAPALTGRKRRRTLPRAAAA